MPEELIRYLIVCPLVFLSGLVDAIGGGGGLISLPPYIFAGLPMYAAIGTNKLSSAIGTSVSTFRYIKHTRVDWALAVPAILLALIGSACGAHLTLIVPEHVLKRLLIVILPVAAFFVMQKHLFIPDTAHPLPVWKKRIIAWLGAFLIGGYDGFYGPGTGTFTLIVLIGFARMQAMDAATNTKLINLTSNIAALVTFLISGQVMIGLGLVAAVFSVAGHYFGSSMMLKNGERIVRPVIIGVLALLFVKIIFDL
jgi:uncharacterized membrane protein YfcA